VAIVAPAGLSPHAVASLRGQARGLCPDVSQSRPQHETGFAPIAPATAALSSFLRDGVREAARLQTLAAHTIRDY
jgi:hypothetical protein